MTSSYYIRGKTRATKKSTRAPKKPKTSPKTLTRKLATKRRTPVRARTAKTSKGAKRPVAKRRKVKPVAAPKRRKAKPVAAPKRRKAKPVAAPKRRRAKPVATPKRRAVAKTSKTPKRRAAPTKRPVPVRRPLTPAQKGARTKARNKAKAEAAQKQLTSLSKARAKLRNKSQKDKRGLRQKLNARLKEIAKRALERKLVTEHLPHATKREKKTSRQELYEHFKARFDELHEIARQKGQLPKADYRERRIRSDKSEGDIRIIRIEAEVTRENTEQMLYDVKQALAKMGGGFPIWMGIAVFTGMGERMIGYGSRILLGSSDPDASNFQAEGIESTGILPSKESMMEGIEAMLDDYAKETYTVVYCEHIKLMNFKRINGR